MHDPGVVAREDSAIGSLVVLSCLWCSSSQSIECFLATSWHELGISEALVVSIVAEKLSSIFEEMLQVLSSDAGLVLQSFPVSIGSLVQLNDEVKDVFRLGGDLAKRDSGP